MSVRRFALLIALLLPAAPATPQLAAQASDPDEAGLSEAALNGLADEIASWAAAGDVMGAELLIIKDGAAVLHESVGWSDRERALPLRRNSIFRIRSMTKPLLGTAVLMLMEEGRLSLDDPVAMHLPSFDNERSRSITIRQLLTHTSGLGNHGEEDIGLPSRGDEYETLRELVDDIGELGPAQAPGEFHYSDSGSATLGALVAEISRMPVERFIQRRILDPLGMADTHTRFTPDVPWAGRMNSTYRWSRESCGFERYWEPSMDQRFKYFRASGGVYSTPADYARFVTMWMNGGRVGHVRLLSTETVEAALRPVARRGNEQEYAMHWTIQNSETANGMPLLFGHGGSDGTLALAFPAIDAVVLYFTQSRYHDERTRFRSYLAGVSPFANFMTAEGKPEIERQWSAIRSGDGGRPRTSPGQLTRYVGSYSGPVEHEVLLRGDALIMRLRDAAVPLHPVSPHVFLGNDDCADRLFRITFTEAEDGTISRYRLEFADGLTGDFERKR